MAECSLELGHELLRDLRWTQAECLELHQAPWLPCFGQVFRSTLGTKDGVEEMWGEAPETAAFVVAKDRALRSQIDPGVKIENPDHRFCSDFSINVSSAVAVPDFDFETHLIISPASSTGNLQWKAM